MENRHFHKFIILTMMLQFPHDSAIRWEEILGVLLEAQSSIQPGETRTEALRLVGAHRPGMDKSVDSSGEFGAAGRFEIIQDQESSGIGMNR